TVNNGAGTNGAMKIGNAFGVSLNKMTIRGGSGTIAQMMTVTPNTGAQFQLFVSGSDIAFSSSGGGVLVQPQGSTSVAAHFLTSEVHNSFFGLKLDASLTSGVLAASIDNTEFFSFNGNGVAIIATGSGSGRAS